MNLLITGAWQDADKYLKVISDMGHSVMFMQQEKDDLPCPYDWVEGVICNGLFLSHPIDQFSSLKYIQLTSAGYDRVPMDYINDNGIVIKNARGVYSIPMAEFAVFGVLQLYKQASWFYRNQKSHNWEKNRNIIELTGKTVCIIGCGSVGIECAKKFSAFDCKVMGVDVKPYETQVYCKMVSLGDMDAMIENSDVVVLTLPLTDDTYHLINADRLKRMNSGAVLVNISRGGVIDQNALIEKLEKRELSAVLDVFEEEPLSEDSPLWDMENVVVTPHNSFVGDNNGKRLRELIIGNLEQFSL